MLAGRSGDGRLKMPIVPEEYYIVDNYDVAISVAVIADKVRLH